MLSLYGNLERSQPTMTTQQMSFWIHRSSGISLSHVCCKHWGSEMLKTLAACTIRSKTSPRVSFHLRWAPVLWLDLRIHAHNRCHYSNAPESSESSTGSSSFATCSGSGTDAQMPILEARNCWRTSFRCVNPGRMSSWDVSKNIYMTVCPYVCALESCGIVITS